MKIPYGRQLIDESDIAAVNEVLRGDWLTQGPTIEAFEDAVREYVGAQHAIAFSSCTAALHASAWAAGITHDQVVYTSPLTFMASANAARYVGARPGLVDIEPDTWNMDLRLLPNPVDAIVAVHYAGLPMNLAQLGARGDRPIVIEDAAHALGAHTPDGPIGNCANSDMTCFSFHPVKPITSGEGGMVTTNDGFLADRLRRFRSHGIVRKPEKGDWYYEISELGFHYRMTDIQAALGLSQMSKLDNFISRRNQIAQDYREAFAGNDEIGVQAAPPDGYSHGYHLFPIRVRNRKEVFVRLRAAGVGVQVHYVPVHHHPISSDIKLSDNGLPIVDQVYEELISLPIFPGLTGEEQQEVISLVLAEK